MSRAHVSAYITIACSFFCMECIVTVCHQRLADTSRALERSMNYGVRTKVSPDASARAPRRPAGCCHHAHDGSTATTRLHAPVKSAAEVAVRDFALRLHSCVRRRHWAPTNEFMTWRWSIDLLSLLALPAAPRRSTSWRELMDVSCWVCRYSTAAPVLPTGAAHLSLRS